jgi:hypothetical protein
VLTIERYDISSGVDVDFAKNSVPNHVRTSDRSGVFDWNTAPARKRNLGMAVCEVHT